jgi:MFS family permease
MISLSRYGALLTRRDLRGAIAASIVGRLPVGMTGLSILLLVQAASHSFASGGLMTAAYVAGLASVSPLLGRVIDRSGPRTVLRASTIAFPAALCLLVLSAHQVRAQSPLNLLLAFAAGAGFPPITVCMRTFLRQRLGDDPLLSTAYSLESVLIETMFIVGPMFVAALVGLGSPEVAVLLAAGCGAAGTLLFLRSPALTHWRVEPHTRTGRLGPLATPGFAWLLLVIVGYANTFGLVEIGVAAYAASTGHTALAGVLLSLMSVGSVLGGLAYGSRTWRLTLARQFALALALMGIGVALLAPAANVWLFALLSFAAGLVMAPALTIQSMLVARTAAQAHATEAFTWSSCGLLAGVGLGMAFGGWAVERYGWRAAFIVAAAAALGSAAAALRLRPQRTWST